MKVEETGVCGTDQTGEVPVRSRRGNQYIFVLYNYDTNSILVRPMKNRTEEEFLKVHEATMNFLKDRGQLPKIQKLDIEASELHKQNIKKFKMDYQLTPAQLPQSNIAERAIQTFKNHFISILAGTNSSFQKNEWDLLLSQA